MDIKKVTKTTRTIADIAEQYAEQYAEELTGDLISPLGTTELKIWFKRAFLAGAECGVRRASGVEKGAERKTLLILEIH